MRVLMLLAGVVAAGVACPMMWAEEPEAKKEITLMGTFQEWMYPGAKFGGASMEDGGNRRVFSVNCTAFQTTGDTVEEVEKHYREKFPSRPSEADADIGDLVPQSTALVDDSKDRPVQMRIVTINRADSTTTLVISRAEGEKKTHIAWTHYQSSPVGE